MARQVAVLLLLLQLSSAFATAPMARPGCPAECGGVQIPYPFGIGDGCFLDDFEITCNETTNPPKPFLGRGNLERPVDIDLVNGLLQVEHFIAHDCYDKQGARQYHNEPPINLGNMKSVRFSDSHNKFVAFGCDTLAYLTDMNDTFRTGCVSCNNMSLVTNGTCSGIGCCETRIPKGVSDFRVELKSFVNHTNCWSFSPCSYAFLADLSFSFNASDFLTSKNVTMMPVTLEWTVGNKTCEESREEEGFACVDVNSQCNDSTNGQGYRCGCSRGYQGNPYVEGGCEDIDECSDPQKNQCIRVCKNMPGSYLCTCPSGMLGDGRKDGSGCTPKFPLVTSFLGGHSPQCI